MFACGCAVVRCPDVGRRRPVALVRPQSGDILACIGCTLFRRLPAVRYCGYLSSCARLTRHAHNRPCPQGRRRYHVRFASVTTDGTLSGCPRLKGRPPERRHKRDRGLCCAELFRSTTDLLKIHQTLTALRSVYVLATVAGAVGAVRPCLTVPSVYHGFAEKSRKSFERVKSGGWRGSVRQVGLFSEPLLIPRFLLALADL